MKVLIYGTPQCKFCTMAKELCERNGFFVHYNTVGFDITKEQLEEKVGRPVRTVPQIFIMEDGFAQYIGGYQEFKAKIDSMGA